MPLWVKLMLLGMGLIFLSVGAIVGLFGTRQAQAHVALIESLSPLSAAALDEQPSGANALVEGVVSPRNRAVFRNFVAYVREELDVTTDSDGDRSESWRSDGRETPRLVIEANGIVLVGNQSYSIARGHETWYDGATLGFNDRPRDGSQRYHGLLAGRPVVAFGTVVEGPEGKELSAQALFGGTREEYLASQREATAFMPIFGAIFGAIGLLLSAIGGLFLLRR
jgi:hypothetical protein